MFFAFSSSPAENIYYKEYDTQQKSRDVRDIVAASCGQVGFRPTMSTQGAVRMSYRQKDEGIKYGGLEEVHQTQRMTPKTGNHITRRTCTYHTYHASGDSGKEVCSSRTKTARSGGLLLSNRQPCLYRK